MADLGQGRWPDDAHVDVGRAETELSQLLLRVERGEEVVIDRNGVPAAALVKVTPTSDGTSFLNAFGGFRGQLHLTEDLEFTDAEIDEMLDDAS